MSASTLDHTNISSLPADLQRDVTSVSAIEIVPNLLDVICRSTGMGFAAIARVTEGRWVACSVKDDIFFGLQPGGELKLETTICHEIRQCGQPVIIDHVAEDPLFAGHHTPAMYGFQSYISVPIIRKDGRFFGTLCAIDPRPHKLETPEIRGMFTLFADLIAFHLESVEKLGSTQQELKEELATAVLRDQFIAVLGHDLKNPVSAISNGAQMLQRMELEPDALTLAGIIKKSAYRISELVENILDFARGKMGSGITLKRQMVKDPGELLLHVINELKTVWKDRTIEAKIDLPRPLLLDSGRIGQLLSNLLGNALTHGAPSSVVTVRAEEDGGRFTLSVINKGTPIPKEMLRQLFEPFSRGNVGQDKEGLGLGLYIAYQIAAGHDGDIEVDSTEAFTRFTFSMPV